MMVKGVGNGGRILATVGCQSKVENDLCREGTKKGRAILSLDAPLLFISPSEQIT